MLAMGDAFRNGGLLMAPILTVFIGTVCIYNNHILVRDKINIISKQLRHRIVQFGRLVIQEDKCEPLQIFINFAMILI